MPIAVITFDEPEFEPSYVGTSNAGKSIFAWLFFTGRCSFSHLSPTLLQHGVRGVAYFAAGILLALSSLFRRSETVFDLLERENVRATFFGVIGLLASSTSRERYLPIFQTILARGHELGLHGLWHRPLSEPDLQQCRALAETYLAAKFTTYSSPFGDDREDTVALLERQGFRGMRVWRRALLERPTSMRMFGYDYDLDRVEESTAEVVVVNLHSGDFYPRGKRRIKRVIASLKARGYTFMTFDELCRSA